MAVVPGALSLAIARTMVLSQSSGHKLLKEYKRPAMHFEKTADSDTVSTYQVSSVQLVTDIHVFSRVHHERISHTTDFKFWFSCFVDL